MTPEEEQRLLAAADTVNIVSNALTLAVLAVIAYFVVMYALVTWG